MLNWIRLIYFYMINANYQGKRGEGEGWWQKTREHKGVRCHSLSCISSSVLSIFCQQHHQHLLLMRFWCKRMREHQIKTNEKKKMTEKTKFKMKAQNRICFKLLMREGRYGIFLSCLSKRRKRPQSYLTPKYMSQMALFIGENQCI